MTSAWMEQTALCVFQSTFWHCLDYIEMGTGERGSALVFGDCVSGETNTVKGDPEVTKPGCEMERLSTSGDTELTCNPHTV